MNHLKPYYERENIVLYNCDCLELLSGMDAGSVDLCLTDPPYGIGEDGGDKKRRRHYNAVVIHERMGWDKERPAPQIFKLIFQISREQVICGANYFSDLLPASMGWIYWDKRMGGDFSDGELIFTSQKKALRRVDISVFAGLHGGHKRQHPTQKPVALIEYLIGRFPQAQTILDPFTGSGTTGVACVRLGRKFIGCEISEKYCEIAARRIDDELNKGRLFEPQDLAQPAKQEAFVL